ncbi:MAG: thiamine pyrophosphate-dependent enzyme, partial [Planctomycetota bacterium]
MAERCYAYNVPAMIVDGQDVVAVYLAVSSAVKWARVENQMTIIEAKT